jgi:hypothetical protein
MWRLAVKSGSSSWGRMFWMYVLDLSGRMVLALELANPRIPEEKGSAAMEGETLMADWMAWLEKDVAPRRTTSV